MTGQQAQLAFREKQTRTFPIRTKRRNSCTSSDRVGRGGGAEIGERGGGVDTRESNLERSNPCGLFAQTVGLSTVERRRRRRRVRNQGVEIGERGGGVHTRES